MKAKRMKLLSICLLAIAGLCGCSKPLPQDKLSYIGEWQSEDMYLLILADGSVSYKRLKNGSTTTINAPLKEFDGDDFVVGFAFFTTIFDVSQTPQKSNDRWTMVVDGVTLTKPVENK